MRSRCVRSARAAGRSLDLQYYIWHDDFTGRLLDHELLRAADRGVRVRLLLDDLNAHGRNSILAALDAHPNIEVRMFNPTRNRKGGIARALEMLLRMVSVNRRMHNKAWIADGRIAVVGGRNIGDEYFSAATDTNFIDLDALVVGRAVRQAEAIFDEFWNGNAAADKSVASATRARMAGRRWSPRRKLSQRGPATTAPRLSGPAER